MPMEPCSAFVANPFGDGYEIVSPTGKVIAWAPDAYWANIIIALLNKTEQEGLSSLGEETVRAVVTEIEDKYRRRMGQRIWELYQTGNWEEFQRITEEKDAAFTNYAIDFLGKAAAKTFCDLPASEIAEALCTAATNVAAARVRVPFCEHDWQGDEKKWPARLIKGHLISAIQSCVKCGAMRESVVPARWHEALRQEGVPIRP